MTQSNDEGTAPDTTSALEGKALYLAYLFPLYSVPNRIVCKDGFPDVDAILRFRENRDWLKKHRALFENRHRWTAIFLMASCSFYPVFLILAIPSIVILAISRIPFICAERYGLPE